MKLYLFAIARPVVKTLNPGVRVSSNAIEVASAGQSMNGYSYVLLVDPSCAVDAKVVFDDDIGYASVCNTNVEVVGILAIHNSHIPSSTSCFNCMFSPHEGAACDSCKEYRFKRVPNNSTKDILGGIGINNTEGCKLFKLFEFNYHLHPLCFHSPKTQNSMFDAIVCGEIRPELSGHYGKGVYTCRFANAHLRSLTINNKNVVLLTNANDKNKWECNKDTYQNCPEDSGFNGIMLNSTDGILPFGEGFSDTIVSHGPPTKIVYILVYDKKFADENMSYSA